MQAPLAVISALLGAAAWWTNGAWLFAVGALLILGNLPYTLIVIMPVNHRLEAIGPDDDPAPARSLIHRWARLHAGRSALGAFATLALSGGARPDQLRPPTSATSFRPRQTRIACTVSATS